ncbi:hypothetical protein B0H21DRAFT_231337 [Amylocystis lapponica]|nr:hypothetical protein B0H21DRAFT_231337 [Amylocystis lapponica]
MKLKPAALTALCHWDLCIRAGLSLTLEITRSMLEIHAMKSLDHALAACGGHAYMAGAAIVCSLSVCTQLRLQQCDRCRLEFSFADLRAFFSH